MYGVVPAMQTPKDELSRVSKAYQKITYDGQSKEVFAKEHGWKCLGAGAYKAAFAVSRYHVVKIVHDEADDDITNEVKFHKKLAKKYPHLQKFFLKPIMWDEENKIPQWIVYPRAIPLKPYYNETTTTPEGVEAQKHAAEELAETGILGEHSD